MSAPCQAVLACPVPTTPGIGFSSETFVPPSFAATATAPITPPPLGWGYGNPVVTAPGESTVSEAEAEMNAWLAASAAAATSWTPPGTQIVIDDFSWNEDGWDVAVEPIF